MVLITFLYLIRSLLFTVGKGIVTIASPMAYLITRMALGGVILLGYSLYARQVKGKYRKTLFTKDLWRLTRVIIASWLHFTCFFWALQYLSSIDTALIFNITPFIAAFFSYQWFGEVMTRKKFAGLALGLTSLFPIYYKHLLADNGFAYESVHWSALVVMTISAFFGAYRWVVIRSLVKKRHYPIVLINSIAMLSIAFLSLAALPFNGEVLYVNDWGKFGAMILLVVLIGNIISENLYAYLLKRYTATLVSFAGFIRPFFVAAFGFTFLDEIITLNFLYTLALVVVGIYLFYQEELRQGYVDEDEQL